MCSLWRYLGPNWTTGTQQNDLLDILSDRITAQPALAERLQVRGLTLSAKIIEVAATQDPATYKAAQTFRWIRTLGEEIVHGRQGVLTIHHLGKDNQHWVAIVIDGEHPRPNFRNHFGRVFMYGRTHLKGLPPRRVPREPPRLPSLCLKEEPREARQTFQISYISYIKSSL